MAIGWFTVGASVPLVTGPSWWPWASTMAAPSRTGTRSSPTRPTRLRRAVGQLAVDHRGAGVAAGARATGAAHLLDRPGQAGFDRRGACR